MDISTNNSKNVDDYQQEVEEKKDDFGSLSLEKANRSLRVCCYGSSSNETPKKFLKEAYTLGLYLAGRGHTCVNGAGAWGCMAAMNEGADDGGGKIVGVIHEMFLVDGSDWLEGSHRVFHPKKQCSKKDTNREVIIAKGDDLQQRKKLLVTGADALIVLPGGPGTWDELWEMACSKNIGLTHIPIVCVDVDGYYKPFQDMLQLAYENKLVKNHPSKIVHFEPNSVKAVQYVENWIETHDINDENEVTTVKRRSSSLSSFNGSFLSVFSKNKPWLSILSAFFAGAFIGSTLSLKKSLR